MAADLLYTVIKEVFKEVIKEVWNRLWGLSENREIRERIEKNREKLEKVASVLNDPQEDNISEAYKAITTCFNDTIGICKFICTTRGDCKNVINVRKHKVELETLESELRKAGDNLQPVLLFTLIKGLKEELHRCYQEETRSVKEELQRCQQEMSRDVIHPGHGVFLPKGKPIGSCPHEIEQPQVALVGNLIEVKWRDDRKDTVDCYEVQYGDESSIPVSATVEECMRVESPNSFSIRLGSPRIKLGKLYTFRVRGTNGAGEGNWSKPTIFRFKTGPPNKPKKPTGTALSPTEIEIMASRLSHEDENGSSVTHCKIEYKIDGNPTWKHLRRLLTRSALRFAWKIKIESLKSGTTYCLRIKMINGAGESPPSDSLEVTTTRFKPGPPQNLCIFSKGTTTMIKLSWKEPALNPQAACKYNVQMRPENALEWINCLPVKENSMEFEQLETYTKYLFRVQSMNNMEEAGEWSNEIEATTRVGTLGLTLAVIVALLVGGTIGAPIVGAVAGFVLSDILAEDCAGGSKVAGDILRWVGAVLGYFSLLVVIIYPPILIGTAALSAVYSPPPH